MISSITHDGRLRWMVYKEKFNAEVFIRFLEQFIRRIPQKIFLILDNLRVHHSAPVKEWAKDNAYRIKFFLPTYSPECNPDEYLNHHLKASLSRLPSPKDRSQLESYLKSQMRKLAKLPHLISSFFKNKFVAYTNII